ncbi:acyl-ACP thioesterase [Desulfovibrio sp. OttesenSCG-928-C06]|nr:acyl-ACP thioesterase [Desulfovibrio sp. OttesenSCG-928-C06]
MNWVRTEKFKIRGYEVGPDERVPVQSLCGYMEEAASLHATELGFSVESLHSRGLAWALARMQMEVYELPGVDVDVFVKTWPVLVEKLQYRRDFHIYGEYDGRVVDFARAVSDWVVINLESRRVERMPSFIEGLQPENPEYVLEKEKLRIAGQEDAPELVSFRVRKADIDRNRHVNNVRFLDWILESVPDELSSAGRLAGFQVMYRAEAVYGDTVLARGSRDGDGVFLHGLFRESDGQELVRAKSIWR